MPPGTHAGIPVHPPFTAANYHWLSPLETALNYFHILGSLWRVEAEVSVVGAEQVLLCAILPQCSQPKAALWDVLPPNVSRRIRCCSTTKDHDYASNRPA